MHLRQLVRAMLRRCTTLRLLAGSCLGLQLHVQCMRGR